MKVAQFGMTVGVQTAGRLIGDLGRSAEERKSRSAEMNAQHAALFAEEIGKLKGSLMKAGQLVSMFGEHFFPPEVNKFLRTLHNESPPVAWSVMEKVLRRQLSDEVLAKLEIDPQPWAAASLGQVHRAREKATGRELCVKIQYPGVDRAIDSDLRSLRSIFSVVNLLPVGFDLDPIFAEIRAMLKREVAYDKEFEWTVRFRDALADDGRYVIPQVIAEYSGKRVITTTFEEGVAVDSPEVAALSAERRNSLATAGLDLFFREFFRFGFVQTDPHFGNYRIRLGGNGRPDQMVLLDFGAVRVFPEEFLRDYYGMVRGAWDADRARFEMSMRRIGVCPADAPLELRDVFWKLARQVLEPFGPVGSSDFVDGAGNYDWGRSDLPTRAAATIGDPAFRIRMPTPPGELVFLDRKLAGVYIFLRHLGACINSRQILEGYLPT